MSSSTATAKNVTGRAIGKWINVIDVESYAPV